MSRPGLDNRWQRCALGQAVLQRVVEFVDVINFASQDRDEAGRLGVTLEQDRASVVVIAPRKDRLHFPERVNVASLCHAGNVPGGVPHHPVVLAHPREGRECWVMDRSDGNSDQRECGVKLTWLKECTPLGGNGITEKNGPHITVMPRFRRSSGTRTRASSVLSCRRCSRVRPLRSRIAFKLAYVQL